MTIRFWCVAAVLTAAACGSSSTVDGGASGGGNASLGGGTAQGGGASGTGGGSAGGGASGGGSAGGSMVPTYSFAVVLSGGVGIPTAAARLSGPTLIANGTANADGVITVEWPESERPFDLTVAAPGHEAVSIIGLTTDLPQVIRIDPTTAALSFNKVMGAVTGHDAGTGLGIDGYDAFPQSLVGTSFNTDYIVDSAHPLTLVALEHDYQGALLNWATTTVPNRENGGTRQATLALPSPPAKVKTGRHTFTQATQGLLRGAYTMDAELIQPSHFNFPPGLNRPGYVQAGFSARDGAADALTFNAIDDPMMGANRLAFSLTFAGYTSVTWVTDPFVDVTTTLPVVEALTTTGTTMANVAASATATGFDTLELQLSSGVTTRHTTWWRCYTAPGAPLRIDRLPTLPAGITPTSLGVSMPIMATPMVIQFASTGTRPWQLQGGDTTSVLYRQTAAGPPREVTAMWR